LDIGLNESQREAMRFALAARDVAVIHGIAVGSARPTSRTCPGWSSESIGENSDTDSPAVKPVGFWYLIRRALGEDVIFAGPGLKKAMG
jgi:hypothetical protein